MIDLIGDLLPDSKIRQNNSITMFIYQYPICWVNVWGDNFQVIIRTIDLDGNPEMMQWGSNDIDAGAISSISFFLKRTREFLLS